AIYRVYRHNLLPRYDTTFAMRLHPFDVDMHGPELTWYYGDLSPCVHDYAFDDAGIVTETVPFRAYNPTMVSEWALIQLEGHLRSGSAEALVSCRRQLEWLIDTATPGPGGGLVWQHEYDTPEEAGPWISGIAQGMAISALLRGHCTMGDAAFRDTAVRAFEALDAPVEVGGLRFTDDQFPLWYEEDSRSGHILNGHLYALLGVFDLYRSTGSSIYKDRFELGLESTRASIEQFDLGFYSKYRFIDPHSANGPYHAIHVALMRILHQISGQDWCLEVAERWDRYARERRFKVEHFAFLTRQALRARRSRGVPPPRAGSDRLDQPRG
ncbi:MAG: hypothetical protein JO248_11385, partial [Acidimicrobiia bacterium]|nr:hypothetical protein [Acidimicrobiia bacterium]